MSPAVAPLPPEFQAIVAEFIDAGWYEPKAMPGPEYLAGALAEARRRGVEQAESHARFRALFNNTPTTGDPTA